MYQKRIITERFLELLKYFPVVVITGARQVGKSTFLQNVMQTQAEFTVFDPVIDIENARQDPDLFLKSHKKPLVLDEIQYAPEVVPAIKRFVDIDRKPGQYILSGSQAWGVLKSVSESLAGRAVFLDMEGFSLSEICGAESVFTNNWLFRWLNNPEEFIEKKQERLSVPTSVYKQIWQGWLPEAQFLPDNVIADYYSACRRTYIERDVRLLADISDLQAFGRFIQMVSALSAQEINQSQIGRELGITPQTAKRWLTILQSTFQWFEVPAFSANAIKRISLKSKGYIMDTGLACTAQVIPSPHSLAGHPLWGRLFETTVVAEIRKLASVMSPKPNMYHWRLHSGAEVDIILEYEGKYFPIEIKAKSHPAKQDTYGIKTFRELNTNLRVERGLVIAPCEKMLRLSETEYGLPWDTM